MLVRTPRELGATIRDHRRQQGLDQQELASKIGVSRQWVVEVEKGKPRAEVGLVLRALDALGVILSLERPQLSKAAETEPEINIDQIVDDAKGKGR
ncbi:MAG: type II toxin-antitoxin system Y4mF family antitoxin [Nitratireductor sp.]